MALLRVAGIRKSYPGVLALAGVDLEVDAGEVHALLGENGAGKSTLMKTIAGSVVPDAGSVEVDGRPVSFGSTDAARAAGVGIVYQELSLVPQRSVAENVLLGRWPTRLAGRMIDWKRLHLDAERHLQRIGFDIDPRRTVSELGMAERQLVEIAKALSADVRVLLLDEPTSALSDRESQRLFELIEQLRSQGVAVIYVSHRLAEIVRISQRVTVLRDGVRVGTVPTAGVDENDLARMMVGRATSLVEQPDAAPRRQRDGVALRTSGFARRPRLKPVDFELHEGEILGVFGLVGAGRTRLARALFGLEPATEGAVEVLGVARRIRTPADAIAAGLGFVSESRSEGLVPRMSVASNITLASLPAVSTAGVVSFGAEREEARRQIAALSIRATSPEVEVETLSGGNQQKVVLARWSCSGARVLILDDPTRGIDVGAKEEVFALVRRLAGEGAGVLYLTSEIREAKALADRVLVMAGGGIVAAVDPRSSEEEIMAMAGGAVV
jgi:ABC-type sugar transport system ATPase subunit